MHFCLPNITDTVHIEYLIEVVLPKKKLWPYSTSDRRLSAKLVPTF
jgi:hypothetical protein